MDRNSDTPQGLSPVGWNGVNSSSSCQGTNTGISAIIDQRGNIIERTPWWEKAAIRGNVNMNDEITYFVKTGDVPGRLCTVVFSLLALALIVRICLKGKKS